MIRTTCLAWVAAACTVLVAAPAVAQPASREAYPQSAVAFPGGVTGLPNLTYSTVSGYRPLKLDLYLPPAGPGLRPIVIFVHGGGWVGGNPRRGGSFDNFPQLLAATAARGYVVASVSYRFAEEARFPAAEQDLQSAIGWLRSHAGQYGADPARVLVWGASAGGQLAALAATACGVQALQPPGQVAATGCVQGAVIWYGVVDMEAAVKTQAGPPGRPLSGGAARELGCDPASCPPAAARAASPMSYIDRTDPPFLLVHGADDKVVPVEESIAFDKALKAAGVPSQLVVIPAADHNFTAATPQAQAAVNKQVLDSFYAFVDATLKPRPSRTPRPGPARSGG